MTENEISKIVLDSSITIHRVLGPGLLEKIYHKALCMELIERGLKLEYEKQINVEWKGKDLGLAYVADLVIENKVIIELKSVQDLHAVHHKQLLSYLKILDLKLGFL